MQTLSPIWRNLNFDEQAKTTLIKNQQREQVTPRMDKLRPNFAQQISVVKFGEQIVTPIITSPMNHGRADVVLAREEPSNRVTKDQEVRGASSKNYIKNEVQDDSPKETLASNKDQVIDIRNNEDENASQRVNRSISLIHPLWNKNWLKKRIKSRKQMSQAPQSQLNNLIMSKIYPRI